MCNSSSMLSDKLDEVRTFDRLVISTRAHVEFLDEFAPLIKTIQKICVRKMPVELQVDFMIQSMIVYDALKRSPYL